MDTSTNILTTEDMLEAVRSTAMLADVSISVWAAEKTDAKLMEEVKANAGATGNVGRAVKNILAGHDGLLKDCRSAFAAVRTAHYQITLPWVSDPHAERTRGPRLLPNMLFEKYLGEMSARRRVAMETLDKFILDYPDAITWARTNLGRLAPDEYPTAEEVRASFKVSFEWEPIPSGAAFRNLPENMLTKLSRTLEARQRSMVETSQAMMWQEVRERVGHLATKLNDPTARFKATTVENVRELIELLPGWNVTGHGVVPEIVDDIKHMLKGIDAEAIREDVAARADIASQATQVMNKLTQWGL